MKEQKEEEKKKVKTPDISIVVGQPANKNIVEKIDVKPRTVSFQGREDDTSTSNVNVFNVHVTFQQVVGLEGRYMYA